MFILYGLFINIKGVIIKNMSVVFVGLDWNLFIFRYIINIKNIILNV